MSQLFSPLKIRGTEFKNRIVVSPMCQYSCHDGFANDWHLVHLGSRAVGGAGLVFTEAAAVSKEGRISPYDLGIWKEKHIMQLRIISEFIHQQGSIAGVQLAHAGRKGSKTEPWNGDELISLDEGGWKTLAPSPIPFDEDQDPPVELDKVGIGRVVNDFKAATVRAIKAGFKVIEIHAAHGYLIHQFLSPLSNKRTDEYGGSFQNRARLLMEVVEAVRSTWPEENPLFVRISATDWVEGGWTIEDSVKLAKLLKKNGVDVVDCSSGAILPKIKIPAAPGYQVPFAEKIKAEAGIKTAAVGIIVSAKQAEAVIAEGKADFVAMGREMLRDPYFPRHAAKTLGHDMDWPVQYERAKRTK